MPDGSTFPRKAFVLCSAKDGFVTEMLALQAEQDAAVPSLSWMPQSFDGLSDSISQANAHRLRTED